MTLLRVNGGAFPSGRAGQGVAVATGILLLWMLYDVWRDTQYWTWPVDNYGYERLIDDRKLQSYNEEAQPMVDPPPSTTEAVKVKETSTRSNRRDQVKLRTTPPYSDGLMYYRTAFLITSPHGATYLRATSVQDCNNKRVARLKFGNRTVTLRKTTIHVKCPWSFAPSCGLVGYFGSASLSPTARATPITLPQPLPPFAHLLDPSSDEWLPLELVDSRFSQDFAHRLAVCLQPMYLMADWPLIPNFFENWMSNGATLFFIYIQSMSAEVDAILRVYEHSKGIEVIRVPWSAYPSSLNSNDPFNPNNRVYRTEVGTAVNDCVLRSRSRAELVVSSDLDEIISPVDGNHSQRTLLEIVDGLRDQRIGTKNKKIGSFMFLHSYAYAENNWSDLVHPRQLSFDHYSSIDIETFVSATGRRSKVVMYPHRIFRAHVHEVIAYEEPAKYATYVVPSDKARVLHFRRVEAKAMNHSMVNQDIEILAESAVQWSESWKRRLREAEQREKAAPREGVSILDSSWRNNGLEVMREIEWCRRAAFDRLERECVTEWSCRAALQAMQSNEWREPGESPWVVI